MKIHPATAAVVGLALGAMGSQIVNAQKAAAGYFVGEVLEVSNQDQYAQYAASVTKTIEQYGGHYLVRGGKTQSLEGNEPKRIVVLRFDTMVDAQKWYDSPEYSAIKPIRDSASTARAFLVEGVTP
jgi:uncharacterized protein (DUF1330 family)